VTYIIILAHCLAFTLFCVQQTRFDATLCHLQRIFWSLFLACGVKVRYPDVFVAFDGFCQNSRSSILFFLTPDCTFYSISSLGWVHKVVTRSGNCILRRFAKFGVSQQC